MLARLLLPFAMHNHRDLKSGMYADLSAGKRCDVDFINGVIKKIGKKFQVATPVNDEVIALIHSIEKGERQISTDNIQEIYDKVFKKADRQ